MFNVGGPEIVVVILVALVVLGPEQLPKAMRTFGNVMAQVRKVSNGFQDEMRSAMHTLEAPSSSTKPSGTNGSGSAANPSTTGSTSTSSTTTSDTSPSGASPAPAAPAVDPVSDRPGISPADRAAG